MRGGGQRYWDNVTRIGCLWYRLSAPCERLGSLGTDGSVVKMTVKCYALTVDWVVEVCWVGGDGSPASRADRRGMGVEDLFEV